MKNSSGGGGEPVHAIQKNVVVTSYNAQMILSKNKQVAHEGVWTDERKTTNK